MAQPTTQQTNGNLQAGTDPPVFEFHNPKATRPLLLICDHASPAVPASMNRLGLPAQVMAKHVAWDIGAAEVTRRIADRLGAPAVLTGYSRLLIDANRQPGDPGSIPRVSDAITIPGNQNLNEASQVARVRTFFDPYHAAISNALAHLWRQGKPPALFSIHSFTPNMGGEARPWDAGVLWNRDPRLAVPLITELRQYDHLQIGDNEPYSGREIAYTIDLHAGAAGLANAAIEIRQDHLETEDNITHWAELMSSALNTILSSDGLHRVEHF